MYNTVMPAVGTKNPEERRRVLVSLIETIQGAADGPPRVHFGFNLPTARPDLPRTASPGDPRVWWAVYRPYREGSEATPRLS